MKNNLITSLLFILSSFALFSQAPQAINYQAVVRDVNNQIITNQTVGIRFVIKQGSSSGLILYTETFSNSTNDYGLINLKIGTGMTQDVFSDIDWSNSPYFLETSMDVTGGTNYTVLGTSEFISVPYVFYAETAGSVLNDSVIDADADPGNEIQALSFVNDTLYLSNGGEVYLGSLQDGTGTDDQDLTGATLTGTSLQIDIENGVSAVVDLSSLQDGVGTDDQNISGSGLSGVNLTIGIEGGSSETIDLSSIDTQLNEAQVDAFVSNNGYITSPVDADADPNNEIQMLSIAGNIITLDNGGGTVTLPSSNIWSINGNNEVYYNGGNVGVGTGIPDYLLDVDGSMGIDDYVYHNDDPNTYLGYYSNDKFGLWLNGSNIIDAGTGFGNAGTITLNPQDVKLPSIPQTSVLGSERVVVWDGAGGFLKTVLPSTLGGGGSNLNGSGQTNQLAFWSNSTTLDDAPNLFYNPTTDRLGVANSNPQYELHVGGSMSMNQKLVHNGDSDTYLEFDNTEDDVRIRAGNLLAYRVDEGLTDVTYLNSDKIIFNDESLNGNHIEMSFLDGSHPSIYPTENYRGYLGLPTKRWQGLRVHDIHYTGMFQSSDRRIKENIRPLESVLERILRINLVSYDYIPELYYANDNPSQEQIASSKNQTGVIAQEIEKIFPELVHTPENPEEFKSVDYTALIPFLVKAIQEQQEEIETLKVKLAGR